MALLLYESLYPSSFRGATFWFHEGDKNAGRKTTIHEYPNKSFRYVEDLGLNLPTFEIRGIIKGSAYLIDKSRLESALNTAGIGILVHPFYGNISVYPLGYSVTEDIKQLGVANFRMSYAVAQENTSPKVTGDNTAYIANLARELYDKINDAIDLEWTLNFIRNIQDATQVIQRVIDALGAVSRIANSFVDGKNDFVKSSNNFEQNKYRAAQDSTTLADNFTGIVSDFNNITLDNDSLFDINKRAYGVGADDTLSDLITGVTVERNKNRRLLNGSFNLLILTNLYSAATLLSYTDELQLDNVQNILDDAFNDLTTNENYLINNDLNDTVTELRNEMRKFFDNLRITVAKVTTIQTTTIPATVLTFNYYGNTDNYQEILDLNSITNPAVVSGEVRILQQ